MAATCVLASILASGVTAHAETDVFMRTVGFALTGRDDADPKVIGDRAKCVFAINRWGNRLASLWIAEDFGCCASG